MYSSLQNKEAYSKRFTIFFLGGGTGLTLWLVAKYSANYSLKFVNITSKYTQNKAIEHDWDRPAAEKHAEQETDNDENEEDE